MTEKSSIDLYIERCLLKKGYNPKRWNVTLKFCNEGICGDKLSQKEIEMLEQTALVARVLSYFEIPHRIDVVYTLDDLYCHVLTLERIIERDDVGNKYVGMKFERHPQYISQDFSSESYSILKYLSHERIIPCSAEIAVDLVLKKDNYTLDIDCELPPQCYIISPN